MTETPPTPDVADEPELEPMPDPRPLTDELMTLTEIADTANVQRATVEQWRARARQRETPFPDPDDNIGSFPVWRPERIAVWFRNTGRPFDLEKWRAKRDAGGYRRGRYRGE